MKKQHMRGNIKLSVIIVNFNTFPFTYECLRSLLASNISEMNYEIIIVDNASRDNSISRLKRYFPSVKYLVNKENIGFARANNLALKRAEGEYVLFLNPDTVVEKNTIRETVKYMDHHPEVGIATCAVYLADGGLDDACHRGFPTPWNSMCYFSGLAAMFPNSKFLNGYHLGYAGMDKIHEIDSAVGAYMCIRKKVCTQLKGLDEDFFWYGEDIDFCYRAKNAGWKIMFLPDIRITHYKGVSSGIKKHSVKLSTADDTVRRRAMKARFDVMKTFYEKHYLTKYPHWFTILIMAGIRILKFWKLSMKGIN